MKIAICDDEAIQRKQLSVLVTEYMNLHQLCFQLSEFQSADQFLLAYDTTQPFDFVILDIQMEGMNGIELAKTLRTQNEAMAILFVTAVSDYVYDSFDINAVNYLLKPYEKERLFACLTKAIAQCSKQEDTYIFQVDKELVKIKESSLLYVESDAHYLHLVTINHTYRIKKTMAQISEELKGNYFYRLGRSYLVNLMAIERITPKEILLMNQTSIWIPKGKHKELSQAFMKFHFHGENL